MVDVNNNESAGTIQSWMNSVGLSVPAAYSGSSAYDPFGDGYVPYNVFIDADHVVRYTDSGYGAMALNEWVELIEMYGFDPDNPYLENFTWEITGDDNGDFRPDPGETVTMEFSISNRNNCHIATGLTGMMMVDSPDVQVTNPEVTFGDCDGGETVVSSTLEFTCAADMDPQILNFHFELNANELDAAMTWDFETPAGRAQVLVVDDDDGDSIQEFPVDHLDEIGVYVDLFDAGTNLVTDQELSHYNLVIWVTGEAHDPLSTDEQEALTDYVNAGGNLLLSSQYLGDDLTGSFMSDVLHAQHVENDMNVAYVIGVEDDLFTPDELILLSGGSGASNNESPSSMVALDDAIPFLQYRNTEAYAGVRYDNGTSKVAYLGFALEAIGGLATTVSQDEFLARMLNWYTIEAVVASEPVAPVTMITARAYPNPFNPETRIELTLGLAAQVKLQVTNMLGQQVYEQHLGTLTAGSHSVAFSGATLASGSYLVNLEAQPQYGGSSENARLRIQLIR